MDNSTVAVILYDICIQTLFCPCYCLFSMYSFLVTKEKSNVIPCLNVAVVTICYVLFMKSFEHLYVKVSDVPKDCLSSACHLGHLPLEN